MVAAAWTRNIGRGERAQTLEQDGVTLGQDGVQEHAKNDMPVLHCAGEARKGVYLGLSSVCTKLARLRGAVPRSAHEVTKAGHFISRDIVCS